MDWYIIQYLYPKSFKRFVNIMYPNIGLLSISVLNCYNIKKLYRFFNNEGILLNVESLNKTRWLFSISINNDFTFIPNQITKYTREEIEIDGFYECFRVLDSKIRENKL